MRYSRETDHLLATHLLMTRIRQSAGFRLGHSGLDGSTEMSLTVLCLSETHVSGDVSRADPEHRLPAYDHDDDTMSIVSPSIDLSAESRQIHECQSSSASPVDREAVPSGQNPTVRPVHVSIALSSRSCCCHCRE